MVDTTMRSAESRDSGGPFRAWHFVAGHVILWGLNFLATCYWQVARPSWIWWGDWPLAVPYAQAGLVGAWIALGSSRLARRLPLGVGLFAIPCAAPIIAASSMVPPSWGHWLCLCLGFGFPTASLALWTLRIRLGLRVVRTDIAEAQEEPCQPQFSVQDVLIWIATISVWLGVARCLGITSGSWRWRLAGPELRSIPIVVIAHTLLLLTAMWAVWGRHRRSVRWAVAAAVWALVTLTQGALNGLVPPHPDSDSCPAAVWSQNGLSFAVMFVSFFLLRQSRYELQRTIPATGDVVVNRRAAFCVLVGLHLPVSLVSFVSTARSVYYWPIGLAQASLLAVWCVLGRPALVWRLPLVLALLFVVCLTTGLDGADLFSLHHGIDGVWLAGQWLLIQIPLWILRASVGLRLNTVDVLCPERSHHQDATLMGPIVVGLGVLIGLDLLFALACSSVLVTWTPQTHHFMYVPVLFANPLLALLAIAIVATPYMGLRPLAALVAIGAVTIYGQDLLWNHVLPRTSLGRTWSVVYCLCFAGTLLYLRALGYRLGRTVRGAKRLTNDAASQ
jgi:hypothetical protein